MNKDLEHAAATLGVWIEGLVNVAVTLAITFGIPYYVWRSGGHWVFIVLSAAVSFLASGFIAERVLFKLTWAEKIFGRPACKSRIRPSSHEREMPRRTWGRHIDFKDLTTETGLADRLMGVDLDRNRFTLEEHPIGITDVDLFEVLQKGMPKQDLKVFHIDETGIRITQREGPGAFYEYSDIDAIELHDTDYEDPKCPRPIYVALDLTFEVDEKKYRLPGSKNETNAAAWLVIRQYNEHRASAFRKALVEGGEICIGKDLLDHPVYLSPNGFRINDTSIPIEEISRVIIQQSGTVDIIGRAGRFSIPLDYRKPESYIFLELIKEIVIPRAMPIVDKKEIPGALNKRIFHRRMGWSLLFSLVGLGVAGYFISKGVAARNWTETYGIVQSHRIEDVEWGDEDGLFTVGYELIVSYKYEVDGAGYTNETFKYGKKFFHFRKNALKLAEDYPDGKMITVYYNPDDPAQSVLESGFGYHGYVFFCLGLFAFVFVIYFRVSYKRAETLRRKVKGHPTSLDHVTWSTRSRSHERTK